MIKQLYPWCSAIALSNTRQHIWYCAPRATLQLQPAFPHGPLVLAPRLAMRMPGPRAASQGGGASASHAPGPQRASGPVRRPLVLSQNQHQSYAVPPAPECAAGWEQPGGLCGLIMSKIRPAGAWGRGEVSARWGLAHRPWLEEAHPRSANGGGAISVFKSSQLTAATGHGVVSYG